MGHLRLEGLAVTGEAEKGELAERPALPRIRDEAPAPCWQRGPCQHATAMGIIAAYGLKLVEIREPPNLSPILELEVSRQAAVRTVPTAAGISSRAWCWGCRS